MPIPRIAPRWIAASACAAALASAALVATPAHALTGAYLIDNRTAHPLVLASSIGAYLVPPMPVIAASSVDEFRLDLLPAVVAYRVGSTGYQLVVSATPYQPNIAPSATCWFRDPAGAKVTWIPGSSPTRCSIQSATISIGPLPSASFTIANAATGSMQLAGQPQGWFTTPPAATLSSGGVSGFSLPTVGSDASFTYQAAPQTFVHVRATADPSGGKVLECVIRDASGVTVPEATLVCKVTGTAITLSVEQPTIRVVSLNASWAVDRTGSVNITWLSAEGVLFPRYVVADPSKFAMISAGDQVPVPRPEVIVATHQQYRPPLCAIAMCELEVDAQPGEDWIWLH